MSLVERINKKEIVRGDVNRSYRNGREHLYLPMPKLTHEQWEDIVERLLVHTADTHEYNSRSQYKITVDGEALKDALRAVTGERKRYK